MLLYDRPTAIEHSISSIDCLDERTISRVAASPLVRISIQGLESAPVSKTCINQSCSEYLNTLNDPIYPRPSWCIRLRVSNSINNVGVLLIDRITASSPYIL